MTGPFIGWAVGTTIAVIASFWLASALSFNAVTACVVGIVLGFVLASIGILVGFKVDARLR